MLDLFCHSFLKCSLCDVHCKFLTFFLNNLIINAEFILFLIANFFSLNNRKLRIIHADILYLN